MARKKNGGLEKMVAKQKDVLESRTPKVLVWDIEVAPAVTLSFNFFKASPYRIIRQKQIITIRWKWYGKDKIYGYNVSDFPSYRAGKTLLHGLELLNDRELVESFVDAFNTADAVVGHNMKGFDIKYLRQRMAFHGLQPIKEPLIIDTLTICRNLFKLESNKLDYVCKYFGMEGKTARRYDDLIDGFLMGNKKDQADMKKYCGQDVSINDKLYEKIAPWMKNHPVFNLWTRKDNHCPVCLSTNYQKRGKADSKPTPSGYKIRLRCNDCGKWWTSGMIKDGSNIKITL